MAGIGAGSGSMGGGKQARSQQDVPPVGATPYPAGASEPAAGYRGPTAPLWPPPSRHPWISVEHQDHLNAIAIALSASDVIALDAEFVQVRARGPDDPPHHLALLQLAAQPGESGAYVIDALRVHDLGALREPLESPHILKLFHGIGADTRVLRTRDLAAHHTLDLEAVSRSIFGQRESGLQTMLLRACGLRLDKSLQRSDWARRPLTPAMLGYAARDAEMTLLLYNWLRAHYPWAIALHEVPAHESPPAIAPWILPFLDGPRPQRAEWAVAAAGLEHQRADQARDLRSALDIVRRPPQRARVLRLISDLELTELTSDLLLVLQSPASDERASAARALGRLRAGDAEPQLRALLDDPTEDVRAAAQAALDWLSSSAAASERTSRSAHGSGWTSGEDDTPPVAGWHALLRARFQQAESPVDDHAPAPEASASSDLD